MISNYLHLFIVIKMSSSTALDIAKYFETQYLEHVRKMTAEDFINILELEFYIKSKNEIQKFELEPAATNVQWPLAVASPFPLLPFPFPLIFFSLSLEATELAEGGDRSVLGKKLKETLVDVKRETLHVAEAARPKSGDALVSPWVQIAASAAKVPFLSFPLLCFASFISFPFLSSLFPSFFA